MSSENRACYYVIEGSKTEQRLERMVQRCRVIGYVVLPLFAVIAAQAQTTQGIVSGQVIDAQDGTPVSQCRVSYRNAATNTQGTIRTDAAGFYLIPLLPPGVYEIRVEKDGYQAQNLQRLQLAVASSLLLNFRLRPLSDVWEQGLYGSVFLPGSRSVLTFFGPDVDPGKSAAVEANSGRRGPLDTSLSEVIDPLHVRELPLAGRDVYATLVLQPGVTADSGTSRGLGLAVNGQRPTASNYLLDGIENNNYLITGPLATVAPESVQEYRVSTNGFSAEYGRTSGFIANAVTRAGGNNLHGIGYFNLKNDALNANSFQRNVNGEPRAPLKEGQAGFQIGGPIWRKTLFHSTSFEYLRSRGQNEPAAANLPAPGFVSSLPPDSTARQLLTRYAPPAVTAPEGSAVATMVFNPPASLDRYLGLERLDYNLPGGAHHLMARISAGRVTQPDFIWTPYPDFVSALGQNTRSVAAGAQSTLRPALTNEARAAWSADTLQWGRAHADVPTLYTIREGVLLPGSPAAYGYTNSSRSWEFLDNLVWVAGRHILKLGGNSLHRNVDGALTAFRDGLYFFESLNRFALGQPSLLRVALGRENLGAPRIPRFDREYRYNQFSVFAQDSFRVSARLAVNFGVRYENFGAPVNVGPVKDAVLQPGPGTSLAQSLAGAAILYPGAASQQLYNPDNNNWAGRLGFSYSLGRNSRTLLRGGYGNFYDRPFDNLWQNLRNNNFVLAQTRFSGQAVSYLNPLPALLPSLGNFTAVPDFPRLTYYQPGIRDGYVHSYFLGLQHSIASALTLEVNAAGSAGRKLIVTDVINRDDSQPVTAETFRQNPTGRYNGSLPLISYRGSQGTSNYNALTVLSRYRARRSQFQIAYTWSHTIDNQSEPLAGDFFNLDFAGVNPGDPRRVTAAFSRQFDSRADRANSGFDQRHNLVFLSIWELPAPSSSSRAAAFLRGWRVSQLGAIRSGFPFTVLGFSLPPTQGGTFLPNHANLIDPAGAMVRTPIPGGERLLNPAAFAAPAPGQFGNTGRNEFRGPGLFNIDLSLSKAFALRRLGEGGRLTFRADAFNVLNHANLNNPGNTFFGFPTPPGTPAFGEALYGRIGFSTGFPAQVPFTETPRQVQLLFRVEF